MSGPSPRVKRCDGKTWTSKSHHVKGLQSQLKWSAIITLALAHAFSLVGILFIWKDTFSKGWVLSAKVVCALWILIEMSALGITAGVHRLWAHRTYEAHFLVRFLLMIQNTMAFQGSIFHWSRDHRVHHKDSDGDSDPHDSRRGMFFSHMGWLFLEKRKEVKEAGKDIPLRDLHEERIVMFQKKFYVPLVLLIWGFLPYKLGMYLTGDWRVSFFAFVWLKWVILLHRTWTINSLAHKIGMRPYNPDIKPTDSFISALMSSGEGWHNYHHTFPSDYACSEYGWGVQWNPTKFYIDFFCLIGLAWGRKRYTVSSHSKSKKKVVVPVEQTNKKES